MAHFPNYIIYNKTGLLCDFFKKSGYFKNITKNVHDLEKKVIFYK